MHIVSPAVKCRPINTTVDYVIVTGHCHADCFEGLSFGHDMYVLAQPDRYDYVEGYVCSDGVFVDRFDALIIAKDNNQLKSLYQDIEGPLQSFMLKGYGIS